MFKQYFKIILRNWKKNKIYTVINIVGLAIAFSITLLISNHVITEWTMDKFHSNAGNIYRITNQYPNNPMQESSRLIHVNTETIRAVRNSSLCISL